MKIPAFNAYLNKIKPYIPGKPVEEVQRELGLKGVIKLASNENPLGPSPMALAAMKKSVEKMHLYPDGNVYYLKESLARKLGLSSNELLFGNGSDELLSFITLTFLQAGEEAIMVKPSFSEYDFATCLVGAETICVDLDSGTFNYEPRRLLEKISARTKVIFICSPNNPTGTVITKEQLDSLVAGLPSGVILVIDQAYLEYADELDHSSGISYVKSGMPVVLLRTFSKIYALAGLRIGYAIAAPKIIEALSRVKEPFNVNAMAQVAALAALGDEAHLEKSRQMVIKGRKQLAQGLARLNLKPVPDQANFCFINLGVDAKGVFQALLKKGIIVRTGDIFGFDSYIRVTYGTEAQNARFLQALEEVLQNF